MQEISNPAPEKPGESADSGKEASGHSPVSNLTAETSIPTVSTPGVSRPHRQGFEAEHLTLVGPFKILKVLGEGGMGTVYLAEQAHPIRRRVALKLIKLGMDTKEVIARFEGERQALALMNHPNVAGVHDGGVTATGRPYFVMEYVPGEPITQYCDKHRLTIRERLELFMAVCSAVQHAHQKGIIHRDIKPSNILVMLQDGSPVPKVIDFGVAKATNQRLTEHTVFTQHGLLIGTPEYMSPEQADLTTLDIDTRTDIYSLGVLLYELLTGTLPFDSRMLRKAGYAEIQRIIREVEPPKPSTRLSSLTAGGTLDSASLPTGENAELSAETGLPQVSALTKMPTVSNETNPVANRSPPSMSAETVASARQLEPRTLIKLVRGDLDWIVMKCLEKDRTRRYESATGLMLDVQRHLNNEPVLAGPPSARYRLRKFVRRHRALVTGGAAFVLLLSSASVGMTALYLRAAAAEREQSRERIRAEAEATKADTIRRFLEKDLLSSVDPASGMGVDVKVRDILDKSVSSVDRAFVTQPELAVSIKLTIGRMYRALGLYDEAEQILVAIIDYARTKLGSEHIETLRASLHLLDLRVVSLKDHYQEFEPLELWKAFNRAVGPNHPDTLEALDIRGAQSMIQGRYLEAEALAKEAIAIRKRLLGNDHPNTLTALGNLGAVYYVSARPKEAIPLLHKAASGHKAIYGSDHPAVLEAETLIGMAQLTCGQVHEASEVLERVTDVQRHVFGERHLRRGQTLNLLGQCLLNDGQCEKAAIVFKEAHEILRSALGKNHMTTLLAHLGCLSCMVDCGDFKLAEKQLTALLDPARRRVLPGSPVRPAILRILASVHLKSQQWEKALEEAKEAYEQARVNPVHSVSLPEFQLTYAQALAGASKFEEAEQLFLESLSNLQETSADGGVRVEKLNSALALFYTKWGKPHKAAEYQRFMAITQPATAPTDNR